MKKHAFQFNSVNAAIKSAGLKCRSTKFAFPTICWLEWLRWELRFLQTLWKYVQCFFVLVSLLHDIENYQINRELCVVGDKNTTSIAR